MSVALVVVTDGRRACIEQSIPSTLENLHGDVGSLVICDDSGDHEYQSYLRTAFPEFTVVCAPERVGYTKAFQRVWATIADLNDEWVWLAEDDFTLNQPVTLQPIITVLTEHPELAQVALLRQSWYGNEHEHGGLIEALEAQGITFETVTAGRNTWVQHRAGFTTNPGLFHRSLVETPWPDQSYSESAFGRRLIRQGRSFAYWGDRKQLCTHIGVERAGSGY